MKWILEYYERIISGEIVVDRWILMLYDLIVKGLEAQLFFYDEKKANKAIRFIENFCRHHEGELGGQLIALELWQKALISIIFGVVDDSGARQYREVFIVVARKNGKTLLAAAIAAYCIYLDGEYGARIYFAAPKLEQAALCFDAFYQMTLKEPELAEISKKRRADIYIAESNSTAKPLAFSAKKSDGLNISLCVADEIASWAGVQGLRFYEVLKSSFGARRQPLLLSISTAGYVNDSIYDELMRRSTAVLMGTSAEKRLLPVLYMVDDPAKWNDLTELRKASPNMNVSVSEDFFREEIAIAENSYSKLLEFKCKYCNLKQSSSAAWLPAEKINDICGEIYGLDDFRGTYCVGGIDLSQTTDLTAASIVIEREKKLYAITQFFMPANRIAEMQEREGVPYQLYVKKGWITPCGENFVDYHAVFDWFRALVEQYEIYPLQIGYDRYSSQYLVKDMALYGFHMDDVYQGFNLTPVMQECEGLVYDGTLRLGSNSLLKAHFGNTAKKVDSESRKCMPIKIDPRVHVDGALSIIDALTVRQKWYDSIGHQLRNEE